MLIYYIVFSCISFGVVSEGRTVQSILGRKASFSWTFININMDAVIISHNSSPLLLIWPHQNQVLHQTDVERMHVYIENPTQETIQVNFSISNVRRNDAGIYKLKLQLESQELNDSVILQIFDEDILPWITMVRHVIFDYSIELQCNSKTIVEEMFIWMVNKTQIDVYDRYSQNKTLLSIKNLTTDDKYNLYTCKEIRSGFESDPYRLDISGPNVVNTESNSTVAKEHERLDFHCSSDCKPICIWNWTKVDLSSVEGKAISADTKLQLKNITRKDAGNYSCIVYNIITGTSLEGFTYLDVVYGPDEIYFNTSDDVLQLIEFDTISLFCSADCFPPCQIEWTESDTRNKTTGSVLRVGGVKNDINCTCQATNPMNANATVFRAVFIKVRSGVGYYITTTLTTGQHIETKSTDLSSSQVLYLVLGMAIISAVGLLSWILYKFRACLHVSSASSNTSFSHSQHNSETEIQQSEHQFGIYWTIVSNARGHLTTAIETDNAQCILQSPHSIEVFLPHNKLEHSLCVNSVSGADELDEYLEPTHTKSVDHMDYIHPAYSYSVEHDDYIHPVHSADMETDMLAKHHTTAV